MMHGFGCDECVRSIEKADRVKVWIFVGNLASEAQLVPISDEVVLNLAGWICDVNVLSVG